MPDTPGRLPLTPMQEGMIFDSLESVQTGSASSPSGPRYLSLIHYRLVRPADPDILGRRWHMLAQTHSVLRTRFYLDPAGNLTQAFPRDHLPGFSCQDISGQSRPDQDQAICDYLEAVRRKGIDPFAGPLCRLVVFDREGQGRAGIRDMALIFHHAVLDGWSLAILLKQLLVPAEPEGKGVPFSRYIKFLAKRDKASDLAYWQARLEGVDAGCRLPGQRPDSGPGQTADPSHHRFLLPDSAGLNRLARQLRISPGRLLQAVWALLLCRYNGGSALFGHVITGRMGTMPGVMEMVGMCVNTIPARVDLPEETVFSDWIGQWNRQVTADESHGFASPTALNKLMPPKVSYADLLFVADPSAPSDEPQWVRGYGEAVAGFTAGFELGMQIRADFSYDAAKYPDQAVARMAGHFCRILAAVVSQPDIQIKEISFLTDDEVNLVLANEPALPAAGKTLTRMWQESAVRHADNPALVWGDIRMTYAQVAEDVDRLASALANRGVAPGDRVALNLSRSHNIPIAALAVLQTGAAYLPLAPGWPEDRIRQVLADTRPALVLDDALFDQFKHTGIPQGSEQTGQPAGCLPAPEDPAYIIMTSGTTGRPKGVVVAHQNAAAFTTWAMDRYQWGPGMGAAIQTEFAYDVAIWGLYPALFSGGTVHVLEEEVRQNLHRIRDYLVKEQITHMDLPVAMAEEFMARFSGSDAPPSLRFLATGGDALGRYTRVPYTVVNEYGPTECTVSCTAQTLSDRIDPIPIGRPLPGMRAYILDPLGRLAPLGVAGQLCFSGNQVALGYLGDPSLTAEKFAANPFYDPDRDGPEHSRIYRTGDLACWQAGDGDDRGALLFLGRMDHQVKIRGFRVELGEIESQLRACPGIETAVAALKAPSSGGDPCLTAWVVCPEGSVSESEILALLGRHLPSHMLPRIVQIDRLPLTPGGKIDIEVLPAPQSPSKHQARAFAPPETPAERVLISILAELLPVAEGNVLTGFLDAGGDSIQAIRLAARLESRGWQVLLRDIMAAPTLRALSEKMSEKIIEKGFEKGSEKLPDAEDFPDNGNLWQSPAGQALLMPVPPAGFAEQMTAVWGRGTRVLPPSPTQKMLLTQAALTGPDAYAVAGHYRLPPSAPPPEEIRRRLALALERHEALRAGFALDGEGEAWMVIPRHREVPFACQEEGAPDEIRTRLQDRLARMTRGLDPFNEPLIRLEIFRLGQDRLEMLFHYHHLILDGWSLGLLFDQLFGSPPLPGATPFSFGRYLQWIHTQRFCGQGVDDSDPAAGSGTLDDRFWEERFPAHARPADLPPWPAMASASGASGEPDLSEILPLLSTEAFNRCTAWARKAGVTPAAFFMALWQLLLERYTAGTEEGPLLMGFVSAGRPPLAGIESLVGMCARTLPLALEASGNRSFVEIAVRVQQEMEAVQARYDMPETMAGRLPRHLFSFETLGGDTGHLPRPLFAHGSDGYDLVILFRDGTDAAAEFRFHPRRLCRDFAQQLGAQFRAMARRVTEGPDLPARQISRIPAAAARQLTEEFGRGRTLDVDLPTAVHAFRAAALRFTDLPALAGETGSLTFGQLDARTDHLAGQLIRLGAGRGRVVGAIMSRSVAGAAVALGIMKAGAAYLPLAVDWPAARIKEMLILTKAVALVTDCRDAAGFPLPVVTLAPEFQEPDGGEKAVPLPEPGPEDLAYVICTSGTTGRPKATAVPHRALANQVAWTLDRYRPGPGDRTLHAMAFSFDPSLWQLFPFWAGGTCVNMASGELLMDSRALMATLHRLGITQLALPTRAADMLFDHVRSTDAGKAEGPRGFPDSLVSLCMGGESPQRLLPVDFEVMNAYGPTEACIQAVHHPVSHVSGASSEIGRPLANVQVYVVDANLELCPVGVAGELCISGPQLALGYLGMPDETDRVFLANPFSHRPGFERIYRTGDRVRWLPRGILEFLGRTDGQVKIRGFRIEIREICQVLLAAPGVRDAHVRVYNNRAGQPSRLDAYVIPQNVHLNRDPGSDPENIGLRNRIRSFMASRLPAYMVPATFTLVARWPLSAHGKLDTGSLPSPVLATVEGSPPRTEAEMHLARAWEAVLGISGICREDNFFDIGGHSLQLLKVMGYLAPTHSIVLQDFFKTPKLSDLAARMRPVAKGVSEEAPLPPSVRAKGKTGAPAAGTEGQRPAEDPDYKALVADAERMGQAAPSISLNRIMVTGATGYLGAFLLKEYLEGTGAQIIVPVRGKGRPHIRLEESLAFYFGPARARKMLDLALTDGAKTGRKRILPVSADLSRSRDVAALEDQFPGLDMIVHSAAAVNHYGDPDLLTAANVTATEHLLDLADRYDHCRFVHVSTLSAVNRPAFSEVTADSGPPAENLYSRTKQMAESRVLERRDRGMDSLIFRTGNLILDTVWHKFPQAAPNNMFLRLARMMAKTGLASDGTGRMGPTFVDWAARAICILAGLDLSGPGIFHIDNPNGISLPRLLSMGLPKEKAIERLGVSELKARLAAMGRTDPGEQGEAALEYLAWIGQQERERADGEMFVREIKMDFTLALLKGRGFSWPEMTAALARSVLERALTLDNRKKNTHTGERTG